MLFWWLLNLFHAFYQSKAAKVVDLPQGFNQSIDIILENPIEIFIDLTLCIRFKLERESMSEYRTLFETKTSFFLEFDGFTDVGFFYLDEGISLIFTLPQDVLHPNHWNHLCISINATNYKVVGNGNLWFEGSHGIHDVTQVVQVFELGGDSPYNYETKFVGSISELNMWSTSLSLIEMKSITVSCGAPNVIPDLLEWTQFNIFGITKGNFSAKSQIRHFGQK